MAQSTIDSANLIDFFDKYPLQSDKNAALV